MTLVRLLWYLINRILKPRRLKEGCRPKKLSRLFYFAAGKGNAVTKAHILSWRNTLSYVLVIFIAIAFAPSKSSAYRPFITEDAGVAGKGVAQFEGSWDYLSWSNDDKENVLLFVPIYGITERIELSLEIPYLFHNYKEENVENGIGDITIVSKFLLFEEKKIFPAFAIKGGIKTNSGDEEQGLGSGDRDYSIVVAASKTLGDLLVHAMLGYAFIGDNDDKNIRDIYLYGIAFDYSLTRRFHICSEISGNRHPDREEDRHPISGLVGLMYALSDKAILDSGVRYGFNDCAPKWDLLIGISITF